MLLRCAAAEIPLRAHPRTVPRAAGLEVTFPSARGKRWQVVAGEPGASTRSLLQSRLGLFVLNKQGLFQEDVCLHGAAVPFIMVARALGARCQLSKAPGPWGAAPGAAPPGTTQRRCQES